MKGLLEKQAVKRTKPVNDAKAIAAKNEELTTKITQLEVDLVSEKAAHATARERMKSRASQRHALKTNSNERSADIHRLTTR